MNFIIIIKVFILAIILAVPTYLISVFVTMEWAVANWHVLYRITIAFLYVCALVILSLFIIGEDE
jgi:hypothetical protein